MMSSSAMPTKKKSAIAGKKKAIVTPSPPPPTEEEDVLAPKYKEEKVGAESKLKKKKKMSSNSSDDEIVFSKQQKGTPITVKAKPPSSSFANANSTLPAVGKAAGSPASKFAPQRASFGPADAQRPRPTSLRKAKDPEPPAERSKVALSRQRKSSKAEFISKAEMLAYSASESDDEEEGPVASSLLVDRENVLGEVNDEESRTPAQRYQVLRDEKLGSGGFGTVYKGFDPINGTHLAVKESPFIADSTNNCAAMYLEDEYRRMATLDHPNIVKVFASAVDAKAGVAQIFMEWMSSGSVKSIIDQTGFRLHENVIRRYTMAALDGLAYLHEKNILHRDVKPANMLVASDGVIKLSDFGTSKSTQNQTATTTTATMVGTCAYMAPESITRGKYSQASDLWALGCSIVEMASGRPPWDELPYDQKAPIPMMFYIGTAQPPNHHPKLPPPLSSDLKKILETCFAHDSSTRSTAAALRQLPYFTNPKLPEDAESLKDYQAASKAARELLQQMSSEGGMSSLDNSSVAGMMMNNNNNMGMMMGGGGAGGAGQMASVYGMASMGGGMNTEMMAERFSSDSMMGQDTATASNSMMSQQAM